MMEVPEMDENHAFARVVKLHGTNIVQVETPSTRGEAEGDDNDEGLVECLCLLPAKFSKRFWVKRGTYVVIEFTVAKDHSSSGKIKGTITHILYPDQLKRLRKDESVAWPEVFTEEEAGEAQGSAFWGGSSRGEEPVDEGSDSCDSDGLPPLPRNPNRPKGYRPGEEDSDSDSDSDSD